MTDSYVARNATELREALAMAATTIIKIVDVPGDVEIDLTDVNCGARPVDGAPDEAPCAPIEIPAGVTLRSNRGGLQPGGLIFTRRMRRHEVLRIAGAGARVTGLRLRGPSRSTADDLPLVTGVWAPDEFAAEITNNEISDFPAAAVEVHAGQPLSLVCPAHEPGRASRVRIAGNFLHHNQRQNRGYGVVVSTGAFPLIEQNTFDANRHAIAADGHVRSGYRALDNLVLQGGGRYCSTTLGIEGCWYEQHFDMHGIGEDGRGNEGGLAGDYVEIAFNSFRGEQEYSVYPFDKTRAAYHVRGRPCDRNDIHDNAFVHESDEAIRFHLTALPMLNVRDNRFDIDGAGALGVGDFDGDGRDDLFMATGEGWYYSSGGQAGWRWLARRTERLAQVRIGDFDGDRIADVFTTAGGQWYVARSGREWWRPLAWADVPIEDLGFGDFNGDRITDVFWATGSSWNVSYGGTSAWTRINTSSYPTRALRFGDFDGDGITDVFSLANGQWSVSWRGAWAWSRLNA